jgi:predicted TIM-barrel fold metal-dependent hydrolase
MNLTRRDLLGLLAVSPFAAGGCCMAKYPTQSHIPPQPHGSCRAIRPLFEPPTRTGLEVIDVHAHFFNASDLPVRGFLLECIGHTKSETAQRLLRLLSPLADGLASMAPSAEKEFKRLKALISGTSTLGLDEARQKALAAIDAQREETFSDVARVIRGSQFATEVQKLRSLEGKRASGGQISADEIREIVNSSETPSPRRPGETIDKTNRDALDAIGVLKFLVYFSSYRSNNIATYKKAFCGSGNSPRVNMVLGSLVDFDYWLDCPPRSSHDDQIELYKLLACLHEGFFKPVVAYNPWTDIEQGDAGLARVKQAKLDGFAAAKIYPPLGFMPAGNQGTKGITGKRRPNLEELDKKLAIFFAACERINMPVLAHAEHTNGRDNAHDEFSSPDAWRKLLSEYSGTQKSPVIDFGHFGGGGADEKVYWTEQFATLMHDFPNAPLFGDLGYWVDFMDHPESDKYKNARARLEDALGTPVGDKSAAERVMFGSDWLMLSQVDNWPDYLARVHAALCEIASPEVIAKIFSGNAKNCFNL